MVLFIHLGALRAAIARGNCDVMLMPLGGGVFRNEPSDIKTAMKLACVALQKDLKAANVAVKVLAYEGNPTEVEAFRN